MSVPYVVRKKADLTSGERRELWYGVPRKVQRKGGVRSRELAKWMEKTTGFRHGQIEGILSELVENILRLLDTGQSVTIDGLGTFQLALTGEGCERPEEVTPSKVSVSRVYFVAHPNFARQVKKIKCTRIPFKYYMPEDMMTEGMRDADRKQEKESEME